MKHLEQIPDLPLHHIFDLSDLTHAGSVATVEAGPEERVALAAWAGVESVERFDAQVTLRRLAQTRFNYDAVLTANVTQACVVTLEPVRSQISRQITREMHLAPRFPKESGELTLSAGDDDVPETITGLEYDLAVPLLEEFALAIDPYPRADGAAFTPLGDTEEPQESPFAVLKALKDRG